MPPACHVLSSFRFDFFLLGCYRRRDCRGDVHSTTSLRTRQKIADCYSSEIRAGIELLWNTKASVNTKTSASGMSIAMCDVRER